MGATITLDGVGLDDDEQEALVLIWAAGEVGMSASFADPAHARWRDAAERLVDRGLLFKQATTPRKAWAERPYSLKGDRGSWLAEFLFDASGLDFAGVSAMLKREGG